MLIYLIGIGVVLLGFALNLELIRRALIDFDRRLGAVERRMDQMKADQ